MAPVDVEVELAEGLATRSDLRGIGLVVCQLEKTTLPVARGVLNFAEATVGTIEPQDGIIHAIRCFRCNETELPVRCRQLALFLQRYRTGRHGRNQKRRLSDRTPNNNVSSPPKRCLNNFKTACKTSKQPATPKTSAFSRSAAPEHKFTKPRPSESIASSTYSFRKSTYAKSREC